MMFLKSRRHTPPSPGDPTAVLLPTPDQIAKLQQQHAEEAAAFSQLAQCLLPLMGLAPEAAGATAPSEGCGPVCRAIAAPVAAVRLHLVEAGGVAFLVLHGLFSLPP